MDANLRTLLEKIQSLPPEKIAEVGDFVDFLRSREFERSLTRSTMQTSEAALAAVWSNPEDNAYDAL